MFASPAHAQVTGPAAQGGGGFLPLLLQMAPLILIFGIFYILWIRPQQRQIKAQRAAVDAVKKGDTVVTAGGLIGRVTRVEDAEVEIEIAANTRVRAVKATLAEVRPLGGKPVKPANE